MSICVAAGAWGQNPQFSGFSILATPTIEIFRFLDVGHREQLEARELSQTMLVWGSRWIRYTVTGTVTVTKKSRGGAVLWNRLS